VASLVTNLIDLVEKIAKKQPPSGIHMALDLGNARSRLAK
jgi:hypothetical protein